MITRTQRQKQGIKKWLQAKGRGTWCWATGTGKTYATCMLINLLLKKNPSAQILIVVPTEILKEQWLENVIKNNCFENCQIEIINSVIKKNYNVDLLVLDESHLYASQLFSKVFDVVQYEYVLSLTGTLERLDGKEEIIKNYCPVCDVITIKDATDNGWLSPSKEYAVMLDVDLSEYNEWNRKFNGAFSFFDYSFQDAMDCATNVIKRNTYAKKMGYDPKQVAATAMLWMSCLRKRKEFVMSHPKKIEIARKILNARTDKKCITFSATIKDAEKIGIGYVLHSKQSKKKNQEILDKFNKDSFGVLNSSKSCDQGLDIKGLSVGVILSTDSSKIRKGQRFGRVIRAEKGKQAEIFTLLIRGTQEVNWHRNSATPGYITIDESQLEDVLNGKIIETRQQNNIENTKYRF